MELRLTLPDELARYVEAKLSSGRYESSSEVVREALRLMEASERRTAKSLRSLQEAWQDGIDSGDAGDIDFAAFKAEARARLAISKP